MFIWNTDPIAFSVGPLSVHWYGLLFAGGFVIGYFIMTFMFRRKGYNTDDLDRLLVYIFIGTVIGARLGHCLIYDPEFYLSNPAEILKIWKGGLASHGGTLGVFVAFFLFIRSSRKKYSFWEVADMLTVPIALVCTFIRLGNFMNSEILGRPAEGFFTVVFLRLGETFPRYPAQLFEAFAYFAIFLLLCFMYFRKGKKTDGILVCVLIFTVFTARFFIEPLKEEQASYDTGMILNVGQLLSIPFIIASVITAVILKKRQSRKALRSGDEAK